MKTTLTLIGVYLACACLTYAWCLYLVKRDYRARGKDEMDQQERQLLWGLTMAGPFDLIVLVLMATGA